MKRRADSEFAFAQHVNRRAYVAVMGRAITLELPGQPVGLGRANAHPCRSGIAAPVPAGSVGSFNRPYVPSAGELISQGNLHKRPNVVELV